MQSKVENIFEKTLIIWYKGFKGNFGPAKLLHTEKDSKGFGKKRFLQFLHEK